MIAKRAAKAEDDKITWEATKREDEEKDIKDFVEQIVKDVTEEATKVEKAKKTIEDKEVVNKEVADKEDIEKAHEKTTEEPVADW